MGCSNTKEEESSSARHTKGATPISREKQKEIYKENGGPLEKGSLNSRTGPNRTSSQYNPGDSFSGHGDLKGSIHSVESNGLRLTKGALGDADKRITRLEREQRKEEKAVASTLGSRAASMRDMGSPLRKKGGGSNTKNDVFSNDDNGSVGGNGGYHVGEGGSEGSHGAAPSISDRESTFTTDSMLDKIGKKVNRPRSAKGHNAPEPTPDAMVDRIRCHAMKGLLYDIDDSVEPATMITNSNWEKLLVEKRLKVRKAKEAGLADSHEDSVPGLVGLVNVNNQTDDKTLDDVLSLMSYFPVRGGNVTDRQHSNTQLNSTVPNLHGVPDTKSEGSDEEEKGLEDLTDDENGLRRTSFLVLPDNSPRQAQEFTAVGRFHFSENGKRVNKYYERQVKPWILDYFFGKEEIDATIVPIGLLEPPSSLIHNASSPAYSSKLLHTPGGFSTTSIPDHSQSPGSNGGNSSVPGGHTSYFEHSIAKDPLASRTTNDSADGGMTNSAGGPISSQSQLGGASRPSWGQTTGATPPGGSDSHNRALQNQQMGEEEVIGMLI